MEELWKTVIAENIYREVPTSSAVIRTSVGLTGYTALCNSRTADDWHSRCSSTDTGHAKWHHMALSYGHIADNTDYDHVLEKIRVRRERVRLRVQAHRARKRARLEAERMRSCQWP